MKKRCNLIHLIKDFTRLSATHPDTQKRRTYGRQAAAAGRQLAKHEMVAILRRKAAGRCAAYKKNGTPNTEAVNLLKAAPKNPPITRIEIKHDPPTEGAPRPPPTHCLQHT